MAYTLIVTKAAQKDTQKAYNYYEEASPGLGERFLGQLKIAYTSITIYPANFGFVDDRRILRDRLLKVFPYSVVYKIEDGAVVVVAVHNCHQHPGKRYRHE